MKYSNDNRQRFWVLKYTKDFWLKRISLFLILFIAYSNFSTVEATPTIYTEINENEGIIPGAYQLDDYLAKLANKRVAVVANQASFIKNTHLVDTLLSQDVAVVKVFSPEHGFRGSEDAGATVNDDIDKKTGLPIISLYGNNKKPKSTDLDSIDIIVFDLQDVGVRFYTYISTLHYIMEAAAESNIPVILLDRPNPNGNIIDGPVKKAGFESFISMHPVPVLYGMTIGEYGKMINGEKWLKDSVQCDLTVIEIKNYTHKSHYSLPIPPSPNLRTDNAIMLYPSLCFFEGTVVSVGRGTSTPFELFGHPQFPDKGFSFTPTSQPGASSPVLKGQLCYGENLTDQRHRLKKLELDYLFEARDALYPILGEKWIDRPRFFNLLAGNDELLKQINSFASEREIRDSWKEDLKQFKEVRSHYLIYD
ncbi:MAG: DUF1343 domain-containing protein [Crocinitomicaceae bacterium]|nr:DUF1343 domain-containing protein [Crocinitomicaceae bacterium]